MNAEWIDASSKMPTPLQLVLGFRQGLPPCVCYVNTDGDWFSDAHLNVYQITHWMPLPEPPKRESSFEKWWNSAHHAHGWVDQKKLAQCVWDAAIAASRRTDFVE